MNFDLNALLVFFEVVNQENVTKAARLLGQPKSTVSRKIRHLEDQVGAALLKRANRRIIVTDEGRRLHDHCSRIAAELESAGLQTTQRRTSLSGKLRVSMPIDFGTGWISSAIASFAAKYTEIDLEIHVNGRWVDVSEEAYDVAILLGDPVNTSVPSRRLTALTRGIYASPEHLTRYAALPRSLADVKGVFTEQQIAEGIWQKASRSDCEREHGIVIVNNIGVARGLVISGIGVGVLPNVMCRGDVAKGRLIRLEMEEDIPALQATATYFVGRHVPRRTRAFLDHVEAFLAADGPARLDRDEQEVRPRSQAPGRGRDRQAVTSR
ncbi:LysR family transcriptional regulator (plasmid) [Bosea vestrisii]|uniref:LysR family transcriptional regulator n=1 Tax=Bosea vestrisii TaxID=151416 RepID=UPI0024DF75FC|nr:LysR family transcriptional regulator [Bosea vestrisii]WID99811.1 LysR family transcriptional regulator [Bosea vestrisii]